MLQRKTNSYVGFLYDWVACLNFIKYSDQMYDFYPKSVLYYYSLYAGFFKYKIDLLYTVKVTFYSKISSFTPIPLSQNAF